MNRKPGIASFPASGLAANFPQPLPVLDQLTVGGTLFDAARNFPLRPALVYDGHRANWQELTEHVIAMGARLMGLGVRAGDHVGVLMPNCWDYLVIYHAIDLIGGCAVLLNARYRADDLAYVIPKADIRFLFVGGHAAEHCDYRPMLAQALPGIDAGAEQLAGIVRLKSAPKLERLIELGESRPGPWLDAAGFDALGEGVSRDAVLSRAQEVHADAIGLIIFSSGTTSRPKACMLTHRSLSLTGAAMAARFRFTEQDVVWDPLPLFHMSTMLPFAGCRATGACFIGMGHFDADAAMDLLIAERPTVQYAGFPTIISALISHASFPHYDQSRLRVNHVVGPPELLRRYATMFPGAVAVNSYGLTEASGVPCYSALDDPTDLLFETSGALFDGMVAKIVDTAGRSLHDGEAGEICLKGYAIFAGYYDDAEATADAIDADGWLHTGDLGRIGPGGRLIYDGRLKDMLKIGGENVAAVELESFLMTHPAVRMAQVIGVPDERLMEVAAAFIECDPDIPVTEAELIGHCLGKIASYKIPRYIRFVDHWPMSATKVQKFQLRQEFSPTGKIDVAAMARKAG